MVLILVVLVVIHFRWRRSLYSMVDIRIDTTRARQKLSRFQDSLRHLRPFFESEVAPIIYREIRRVFETEGYGTWPPLSSAYAAPKRIDRPGKGLLRYDDTYFQAATTRGSFGNVEVYTSDELRIGIDPNAFVGGYPAVHEEGSGRIPARPVFGLAGPRVRPEIVRAFRSYFRRPQP